MNIIEIAKKLGTFLDGKRIYFDHKSYDDPNDIPYLMLDGKSLNIESALMDRYGKSLQVTCCPRNDSPITIAGFAISFVEDLDDDVTEEVIVEECEKMGVYELLSDMYYETNESNEIGDFEIDFLGI